MCFVFKYFLFLYMSPVFFSCIGIKAYSVCSGLDHANVGPRAYINLGTLPITCTYNKYIQKVDVLRFSEFELVNSLGISYKDAEELILIVSRVFAPQSFTAWDIYNQKKSCFNNGFIKTSLEALDAALCGGIPLGSITEIVGPPSVGKTQFCLLLSIMTTMPHSMGGLNGAVTYIDTKCAFTATRLKLMAESRFSSFYFSPAEVTNLLQKVGFFHLTVLQDLIKLTQQIELDILRRNVKLIVIDSMASLVKNDFGSTETNIVERSNILAEQAAVLKRIAETFKVAVFLTNQITTEVPEDSNLPTDDTEVEELYSDNSSLRVRNHSHSIKEDTEILYFNKQRVIPCLGNTWAHCVNTRLLAHFINLQKRQLIIWKSPIAPNAAVEFTITEKGVVLSSQQVESMNCFNPQTFNISTKCDFLDHYDSKNVLHHESYRCKQTLSTCTMSKFQ